MGFGPFAHWNDAALKCAAAAAFYAFVSISTTFFNKAVLSIYEFQYTNFLLLSQHVFTIAVLELLKALKLIQYPRPEFSKCIKLLPVSLLYSFNVGVALVALTTLNIPMYGVLKRLTILFVLIGERVFMKKKSTWEVKQAVMLILAGALIAGIGDITFDLAAYLFAFLSCFAQAAYLVYVAKTGAESGINNFGLLFYNSLLAIPFVFVFVVFNDEISGVLSYEHIFQRDFLICFTLNLLLGSLLNYSMFLCTTVNSALTTTIMGQLKNVLSVLLGLFVLETVETNLVNILGLALNCLGGIYYAYVKYYESKMKKFTNGIIGNPVSNNNGQSNDSVAINIVTNSKQVQV